MSDGRDPSGKFAPGNRAGALRKPRYPGIRFAAWCREVLADEDRRARLVAKVDREIDGDGPAPVLTKILGYAFGEPKQVVEAEFKTRAAKLAQIVGVPVETLLAEANRLSREAGYEEN
ncbi:MAG TPA: hypothetical protein PLP50_00875 [Thermoanaerobaculia bacterium]|nr:hypothetical protein [Thermoanaerobaculia bacterium]HQN08686.1 hypothetical protein [Thermoanaerobaculia bacterium]HQP85069.1 hypothetical protein [Thermoanaerobaculia bacterium]